MPRPSPLSLSVLVICGGISAPQAAWAAPIGPLSDARLIAAPREADGSWTIGIVITLAPNAITYWRDPGEAGVPPTFDFSASSNIATPTVSFPAPTRIHEGDIDAIGYRDEVVFPVRVALSDPSKPATVRLQLGYATCERVCLPAHADLTLALPPTAADLDPDRLRRGEAAVPRVLDAQAARAAATVTADQASPDSMPSWTVVPTPADPAVQLFVEGEEGFYLSSKPDGNGFRVTVEEHPTGRAVPDALHLTLVGRSGAVAFSVPAKR